MCFRTYMNPNPYPTFFYRVSAGAMCFRTFMNSNLYFHWNVTIP